MAKKPASTEVLSAQASSRAKWLRIGAALVILAALAYTAQFMMERPAPQNAAPASELQAAAEKGDSNAQYNLSVLYYQGNGVAQDYTEAAKWARKAAAQGDSNAAYSLGNLYANGLGVPKNYFTAVEWYRRSAEHGNGDGQLARGINYKNGTGVTQDIAEAFYWLEVSANSGNTYAIEARDKIAGSLTPEKIAEIQARAQTFQKQ
jgi:TPR repeat protein